MEMSLRWQAVSAVVAGYQYINLQTPCFFHDLTDSPREIHALHWSNNLNTSPARPPILLQHRLSLFVVPTACHLGPGTSTPMNSRSNGSLKAERDLERDAGTSFARLPATTTECRDVK